MRAPIVVRPYSPAAGSLDNPRSHSRGQLAILLSRWALVARKTQLKHAESDLAVETRVAILQLAASRQKEVLFRAHVQVVAHAN